MRFAAPLSPWLTLLAVLLAGVVVYRACVRPGGSLSQRLWLSGLRALSLLLLLVCLAQPVRLVSSGAGQVVPVLIDHSRSMAVADVDGRGRLEAAVSWVAEHLDGELVTISLFGVGDGVMPVAAETVPAEVPRSRLRDAVMEIRERYPAAPAVVLLTDGGETGETTTVLGDGPPVFTLGVGARSVAPDQAVVDLRVAAGATAASAAELSVTLVARGYAGRALEVRVLEDGRLRGVVVQHGVDRAVIHHQQGENLSAVTGNELLHEWLDGHEDAFIPQWMASPEPDVLVQLQELRAAGKVNNVRIHESAVAGVPFVDWVYGDLLEWLQQERIPVWISLHDTWDPTWTSRTTTPVTETMDILRAFPDLVTVLLGAHYTHSFYVRPFLKLPNVHLELSRYEVLRELEALANEFGAERLLYGSFYPRLAMGPILYYMHNVGFDEATLRTMCTDNLERILAGGEK